MASNEDLEQNVYTQKAVSADKFPMAAKMVSIRQTRMDNGDVHSTCPITGVLHREDGPAIERANGDKEWYVDGKRHRANGLPAIERANGDKEWYVDGKRHRDNGLPAIESADGDKVWYVEGKLHREGGLPAIESKSFKSWWVNGKRHREGGLPAVENSDGTKEWYMNGEPRSKDGLPIFPIAAKPVYIRQTRMDNGDVHSTCPITGVLHREDGPAIERANGDKEWYKNGKRHRDGGLPAVECEVGNEWWVDGVRVFPTQK